MRRLALWLALTAALPLARPAAADPPRDSIHEGNAEVWQVPDPQGMSLLLDHRKSSPSGLLYDYPPAVYELSDFGLGWQSRGALEAGYNWVTGDPTETRFTRYVQRKDGFLVDGLNFEAWRPESGDHIDLRAGSLGREDQFYDFEYSRANLLRFRGSFSGVPHKYASDATALWNGSGSQFLALPPGLSPAGNDPNLLQEALDSHAIGTVEVQRDTTQLAVRVRATPELFLGAQYGLIQRNGAIPSAVGFTYPDFSNSIGGSLEVPLPVDDKTHNARASLEWGNELFQMNLAYNGSFYRNQETSLTLQQPFDNAAPITEARLGLPPDNDWNNVRGDLAVNLPYHSRVTTAISWSRSTQNQDLLPPTITNATIGGFDLSQWDTAAALSTKSAHARVDQVLVDIGLYLTPWRPLRLRGGYRFTNQDTKTDYFAFNPQTRQQGYIVEDGEHANILGPDYLGFYQPTVPGSAWRTRNIPFGQARTLVDAGATWTMPWKSSLDVLLERDDVDRQVSERKNTHENRATVSFNTRALSFVTARFSYKYVDRGGSDIDYSVYDKYGSESIPGYIPMFPDGDGAHNLQQMVRPSLADLQASRWNGRLVFALGDRSDFSLVGSLRDDNYQSDYGLTSDRSQALEADWTVQPSPALMANAFFSIESHDRTMRSIRGPNASSSNGDAGGPNYAFANQWGVRAQGDAVGWGGQLTASPLSWLQFDTRYLFIVTRENEDLTFASLGALVAPGGTPVPNQLPQLRSRDQAVETSVRFAPSKSTALRVFYRYTRSDVDDYHQTDLPTLLGRRIYLGHKDLDYAASFFGVGLQVSFGAGW